MKRSTAHEYTVELDEHDALGRFRDTFVISEPDLIYLDGNSLGRLTKGVAARVQQAVEAGWGADLIRGWNKDWWEAPTRLGEMLAAALRLRPGRSRIITDSLNFPSDLYILQGIVGMLGDEHEIVRIGSADGITPDLDALSSAIDESTALVTLSRVAFKSGYLYDMRAITEHAHRVGTLALWDLSHSAGVLPVQLDECDADFAIGCTYKYLNGGPGSPAFLYVNRRLQTKALSPIWGWWGAAEPFVFGMDYQPARGVQRFLTGTAPILSMIALETALAPVLAAGINSIREKSSTMTDYAVFLSDERLAPLGFSLGSPRDPERRGSHISLRHPEGYRINRALIEEMNVIPDFREPDNLRVGFSPLYVSFQDVWEGMERLRRVVQEKRFEHYPLQRLMVT